jgi:hypothetical protein
MTNPAQGEFYSVDTSAFMDWQARYYPTDTFTSLTKQIEALIAENRLGAPELVLDEIKAVGTPGLDAWAKGQKAIFVSTSKVLGAAQSIQSAFPGLIDPKSQFEEADAYVIALAQSRKGIVVTQETSASEKRRPPRSHYIPDVCRELGVPCISLLGMMRRERWVF